MKGKTKICVIIEILEKMRKIKRLDEFRLFNDFKSFVRTNKPYKNQISRIKEHTTGFGILCLNPSFIFRKIVEKE